MKSRFNILYNTRLKHRENQIVNIILDYMLTLLKFMRKLLCLFSCILLSPESFNPYDTALFKFNRVTRQSMSLLCTKFIRLRNMKTAER